MADAVAEPALCLAVIDAIATRREVAGASGRLRFAPTAAFERLVGRDRSLLVAGAHAGHEQQLGRAAGRTALPQVVSAPAPGENPELEMGRYLTDVARFEHCVPVAGSVDHVGADGSVRTLAIVQAFVPNQGDAWNRTVDELARQLEGSRDQVEPLAGSEAADAFGTLITTLGRRTGELHAALARRSGEPAFDPEPVSDDHIAAWVRAARADAVISLDLLASRLQALPPAAQITAQRLLAARDRLPGEIGTHLAPPFDGTRIRTHGDYHLGQVLVSSNDVVIIDFEGEPARELDERRRKHSPLRDVAGMLRSFDYARYAALRQVGHTEADVERLQPAANAAEARLRRTFLDGYRAVAIAHGLAGEAAALDGEAPLLRLFEIEKAFYELRYELNNRPDWVAVPLAGLTRLFGIDAGAVR
jgi:maltose alpha-D-glucosyltransferase / alpha-amylase